jgi:pyruvate dehydrogenase E2 component (dihydrolipoamide acetyltransferase)
MPKMGMAMTSGTIVSWLVADGSNVVAGQPIFELSTEKLTAEVEAESDGMLRHVGQVGEDVPCGTLVGWLLQPSEELPSPTLPDRSADETVQSEPSTVPPDSPSHQLKPDRRIKSSPLARKMAKEYGIDLRDLNGTGPGGRIVARDVERGPQLATALSVVLDKAVLSGSRRVIADRMRQSLRESAQLTLHAEIDMAKALELINRLTEAWSDDDLRPTPTALIVRAAAQALVQHPALNSTITDDEVSLHAQVHLGIAVAVPNGLLVPVLRSAERLTLRDTISEIRRLSSAARDGLLSPDDVVGSTFSVSSLMSTCVESFTPIINPPNVAILGIGGLFEGTRWVDDLPQRTTRCRLNLTIDHSVIDGSPGAAFLGTLKEMVETPHSLLS